MSTRYKVYVVKNGMLKSAGNAVGSSPEDALKSFLNDTSFGKNMDEGDFTVVPQSNRHGFTAMKRNGKWDIM